MRNCEVERHKPKANILFGSVYMTKSTVNVSLNPMAKTFVPKIVNYVANCSDLNKHISMSAVEFNDIGIRSGDSHVIENLSNAHDLVTGNNELVRLNPNAAPFMSTIHHINVEANMFVPFAENSTSPPLPMQI